MGIQHFDYQIIVNINLLMDILNQDSIKYER